MKIKDDILRKEIISDSNIVDMFFRRNECAIRVVERQYGKMIMSVCNSILKNREDSEECTNTVYEKLWNSIPPQKPRSLKAYILRIARFVSLDKYRAEHRKKRINSAMVESLDELSDFLQDDYSVEDEIIRGELAKTLNEFIGKLPDYKQSIFIKRYYYFQSIQSIADDDNLTVWQVKKNLNEMKKELKDILIEKEML